MKKISHKSLVQAAENAMEQQDRALPEGDPRKKDGAIEDMLRMLKEGYFLTNVYSGDTPRRELQPIGENPYGFPTEAVIITSGCGDYDRWGPREGAGDIAVTALERFSGVSRKLYYLVAEAGCNCAREKKVIHAKNAGINFAEVREDRLKFFVKQ